MLAGLSAICFLIAWIMNGARDQGSSWWGPMPLLYLGLFFLALHVFLWGWTNSPWRYNRRVP